MLCSGRAQKTADEANSKKKGAAFGHEALPGGFRNPVAGLHLDDLAPISTRSFDELVHWAEMIRPSQRAGDRTTLPNRLKRLHVAVAVSPGKYGFPKWVSRLPMKGRRVTKPKLSGAKAASIREGARVLADEVDRHSREFISQTRSSEA